MQSLITPFMSINKNNTWKCFFFYYTRNNISVTSSLGNDKFSEKDKNLWYFVVITCINEIKWSLNCCNKIYMDYSIYHNKCNIGKLLHLSFSLLTFFNRDNCPKEHQKGDKNRGIYLMHNAWVRYHTSTHHWIPKQTKINLR